MTLNILLIEAPPLTAPAESSAAHDLVEDTETALAQSPPSHPLTVCS